MNPRHIALLLTPALLWPQQAPAPVKPVEAPPPTVTFQSTSQEVFLDLVIRDRKGRQVKDLRPDEIEVLENGVPQPIRALRYVEGGEVTLQGAAAPTAASAAALPAADAGRVKLDPFRQLRLIVLAFDQLTNESRVLARDAAQDLLKKQVGPNTFFAVATVGQHLKTVQPFTRDPVLLRWAIDRVTGNPNSRDTSAPPASAYIPAAELGGPSPEASNPGFTAANPIAAIVERTATEIQETAAMLERENQAFSTFDTLLALVLGLRNVEGRKSILFFSEGLRRTSTSNSIFQAVIGQANRNNVTFYSIDTRGLVVSSVAAGNRSFLTSRRQRSLINEAPEQMEVLRPDDMRYDPGEESNMRDLRGNLEHLAAGTGGFLIADANDLRVPLQRITEDVLAHYYLSYAPLNTEWDGKFRTVAVTVRRPGVTVQAREGYFALPPGMQALLFPHEVPLLKALNGPPYPRAIDFRAAIFRYRPLEDGKSTVGFHIEIPIRNLSIKKNEAASSYDAHVSFLIFIRDPDGKPVRKATRDVPYAGPLELLPQFQAGNFIYDDHFPLAPGRYTMETAIIDRVDNRVSVRRSVFVVPQPKPAVALSNLILVRRIDTSPAPEKKLGPEDDRGLDPLRFTGGKVLPTLNSEFTAGAGAQLTLYFNVTPWDRSAGKPDLVLEFYQEGKLLARSPVSLDQPEADGRFPYVAVSDISKLNPGDYEVRVVARQAQTAAEERLGFQILPR
jgi:VWFA-related protein